MRKVKIILFVFIVVFVLCGCESNNGFLHRNPPSEQLLEVRCFNKYHGKTHSAGYMQCLRSHNITHLYAPKSPQAKFGLARRIYSNSIKRRIRRTRAKRRIRRTRVRKWTTRSRNRRRQQKKR